MPQPTTAGSHAPLPRFAGPSRGASIYLVLTAALTWTLGCTPDTGDEASSASTETTGQDGDTSTGDGETSTSNGDTNTGDGDGDPSTGDGDGDTNTGDPNTGDGDGDMGCDANAFVGQDSAPNPWGEGDFCDFVYLCTTEQIAQDLQAAGGVTCVPGNLCADDEMNCSFGNHITVDAELVQRICDEVLTIDSVDEVYCKSYP